MFTLGKILFGESIDFHKLIKCGNTSIILGDVKIKSEYKVKAHSDGDLVMHAIANAILGACNKGDIGIYFPNINKYKNMDSTNILLFAIGQLQNKFQINNVDLTIICDKIELFKYRNQIIKNLISLTKCRNINVKFTRFEENKEMIGCTCIVSVASKNK
ncbi:MAG: 2-C-methyl-D-erythritol 2,4-cyclodiphosphate synthase [Mycoplasma sp.]|nr:2-C-methyl-D-erythritol 2,4-cyclodiphosphate synthase [Mycoplasma sp.]